MEGADVQIVLQTRKGEAMGCCLLLMEGGNGGLKALAMEGNGDRGLLRVLKWRWVAVGIEDHCG